MILEIGFVRGRGSGAAGEMLDRGMGVWERVTLFPLFWGMLGNVSYVHLCMSKLRNQSQREDI